MKSLAIPGLVLAGMIAFSLWCGAYTQERTEAWITAVDASDTAAWREDWREADLRLRQAYEDWQKEQTFLHTILPHSELEAAESLFVGALAACRGADAPDFHTLAAQLKAALEHLGADQSASIKNIL